MSDSSSRSTPPPLPSATPGMSPPLPSVALGFPPPLPSGDTKNTWVPPPLPPSKVSLKPPVSSDTSVSHEDSKVLPLAPANMASGVRLTSTPGSTPSSILDSSIQNAGDSKYQKMPPPIPKTAGTLNPLSCSVTVPLPAEAQNLSGSFSKEVEAPQRAPSAALPPHNPRLDLPAVLQAPNQTLVPASALPSDKTHADAAPPKHIPAQSKPPESAYVSFNKDIAGTAGQLQSHINAESRSSTKTKKSWWIGAAALISIPVCGGLIYGTYQWRNTVVEKEALVARHQQEIEARLAAEWVQRQQAEAEIAIARKRAEEAEQAAIMAAAEAKVASTSEPETIVASHSDQSPLQASAVHSQELLPLSAKFDIPAGFPLLKEMVYGSVSGDTDRIERAAVQLQALPKPGAGDRRTARALNNEALRALNAGNPHATVELFQKASLADSSDPEILGNLAWSYLRVGKPSVAFDAAVISLIHTPRRASSWGTLGISLVQQDEAYMDIAVASLQNAYRYAGNPEKSREYFQQIADQDEAPEVRRLGQKVLSTLNGIVSIGSESERMKGR